MGLSVVQQAVELSEVYRINYGTWQHPGGRHTSMGIYKEEKYPYCHPEPILITEVRNQDHLHVCTLKSSQLTGEQRLVKDRA